MPETIFSSDTPSTSSQFNHSSRIICRVCEKQFSQYTCPHCNIRYCSLHCYKSHCLRCTESFIRENVVEELQQLQADDGSKQKMLDIIKRFHEKEETNCTDEDVLSEETVQKIMSGSQISLDDLSAEEMKSFQRAVVSGELSKLIKPWDPWWLKPSAKYISLSQDGVNLVQPFVNKELESSENDMESNQLQDFPPGPETPLLPASKLSASRPSPLLVVHLIDIIYSYCFTLRLYNGDWQSDALESAMVLLGVSSVLGEGGQPETVLEALLHCLEQLSSSAYMHMGGLQFGLGLVDDVISLFNLGGAALVCLLCDMQRLTQAAEKELKSEKLHKSKRVEIKNKLKSAERKVYFIMCWVHEQPAEAWSSLSAIANSEKSSAVECASCRGGGFRMEKVERTGKPLIEEV